MQPILGSILDIELEETKNNFVDNKNSSKILLLATNNLGWKNLSVLVSKCFLDSENSQKERLEKKGREIITDGIRFIEFEEKLSFQRSELFLMK